MWGVYVGRCLPMRIGAICAVARFFFSSRRRHTRCLSDWSSDVCSSDLPPPGGPGAPTAPPGPAAGIPGADAATAQAVRLALQPRAANEAKGMKEDGNAIGRSEERRVGKEGRAGRRAEEEGRTERENSDG